MALVSFTYVVACFFAGVFIIVAGIFALAAGIMGLILLCTPFPYFPKHRQFLVRFWTFAVTALFIKDDYGYRQQEWEKVKGEMRQLASWETAKSVVRLTKEEEFKDAA